MSSFLGTTVNRNMDPYVHCEGPLNKADIEKSLFSNGRPGIQNSLAREWGVCHQTFSWHRLGSGETGRALPESAQPAIQAASLWDFGVVTVLG